MYCELTLRLPFILNIADNRIFICVVHQTQSVVFTDLPNHYYQTYGLIMKCLHLRHHMYVKKLCSYKRPNTMYIIGKWVLNK